MTFTAGELIAIFIDIISLCVNVIQLVQRTSQRTTMRQHAQSAYNKFNQIARFADVIRANIESATSLEEKVVEAAKHAMGINGVADAARYDLISYSILHLGFQPKLEPITNLEGEGD